MTTQQSNPYAVPVSSQVPDDKLAMASWSFDRNFISCAPGRLVLPEICIATGKKEDLIKRSRTLFTLKALPTLGLIGCVLSVPMLLGSLRLFLLALFFLPLLRFSGRFLANTPFSFLYKYFEVTWYVSRLHVRYARQITWTIRTCISLAAFCFVCGIQQPLTLRTLLASASFAMGILLLSGLINCETNLRLRGTELWGTHSGRMMINGFSKKFQKRVHPE